MSVLSHGNNSVLRLGIAAITIETDGGRQRTPEHSIWSIACKGSQVYIVGQRESKIEIPNQYIPG